MNRVAVVAVVVAVAAVPVFALSGTSVSASAPSCGSTGILSGSSPLVCTYNAVGSDVFTSPAGVTQVAISVTGAVGGHYFIAGTAAQGGPITATRPGGAGGQATATLGLNPGDVVQIDVAGAGGNGTAASRNGGMMNGPSGGAGAPGGFGGSSGGTAASGPGDAGGGPGGTAASNGGNGSGGGGSSDVRFASGGCGALTCALSSRLLVGAGGGGGGGIGGKGGAFGGAGGSGGGASGADGGSSVDGGNPGASGTGAPSSGAGSGAAEPGLHASGAVPGDPRYGGDGKNGSVGVGGVGGHGNLPCTGTQTPVCNSSSTSAGGGAGGGGGGGLFGGGAGSGGGGLSAGAGGAGGGGGGGSGFAESTALTSALHAGVNSGGVNGGNGQVTVTWTPPTVQAPSLSSTASGGVVGSRTSATAVLAGGTAPSGTISFRLYGPGDTSCQTPLAASQKTVSGDGSYQSTAVTATAAGTYRWVAGYGGDAANTPLPGSCATAALVVVGSGVATVVPGPPPPPAAGGSLPPVGTRPKTRSGSRSPAPPARVPRATPAPKQTSTAAGSGMGSGGPARGRSGTAGAPARGGSSTGHGSTGARVAAPTSGRLTGLLLESTPTGRPLDTGSAATQAGSAPLSLLHFTSGSAAAGGRDPGWVGWLLGALALIVLVVCGIARESDRRPANRPRAELA